MLRRLPPHILREREAAVKIWNLLDLDPNERQRDAGDLRVEYEGSLLRRCGF